MTIRDFYTGDAVIDVLSKGERGRTFSLALSRLAPAEVAAIRSTLDGIETSSWIPGADWRGTSYQPIYETAAMCNPDLAALMFGLFVWEAFERHPDDWFTERFSMGGEDDRFRVYFQPGP